MKRTPQALLLLAAWLAVLAGLGLLVQRHLVIGTDLRLFLPSPTTAQQRLLLEEIGEGPAARTLVIALNGAPPEQLADASRELVEALREDENFRFITNGELSLESMPDELLPYRYLLSPTLDTERFDIDYLRSELQARARDLASAAGAFLEPWLPRDPTLELLKLAQRWQPVNEPRREFDVWFDRAGERALLIAQTNAPAFDPDRQRVAIDKLRTTVTAIADGTRLTATVSGAGQFSVLMETRTRSEAQSLAAAASIAMVLLLLLAYRSVGAVILSALPLASAGLVGLAAVSAAFGTVHGITLAFGFTLIGVAQDYPIHLLSHRRANHSATDVARSLWPALATGVTSTCIAYFTFLFSGVIGLAQLACFTVWGLAAAGLTTRFVLPALVDAPRRDPGGSLVLDRLWDRVESLPRLWWAGAALAVACAGILLLMRQPLWENDLSGLTPVPSQLIQRDQELRAQLGAPDVRHLLVVSAANSDQALSRLEALEPALRTLIDRGSIAGFDSANRYLPTVEAQHRRQRQLPDAATLRATLQTALVDTPFRTEVFEPFLNDVERARALQPLTVKGLRDSPLGASLEALLIQRDGRTHALVTFSGVRDASTLQQLAASAGDGVVYLDTKLASETLVARQRVKMLWSLALAALLLIVVITISLRRIERVARVLAPMALTTLLVLTTLHAAGVSLTLFHLISLILAAGLGLDYALFFEHASHDRAEQRRTLHAVIVCSLSTLMVFALLATSSLPVLRAIGVTVSLGVIFNFIFALLLTRPSPVSSPHAR